MVSLFPPAVETTLSVANTPTRIVITSYDDRVFIVASQCATFGALMAGSTVAHPDGTEEFVVRCLLGDREDTVATLAARRLAELV